MIGAHLGLMANLFARKKTIILCFDIEGHHSWARAPLNVEFLRYEHRHLFRIKVGIKIEHNDRDKEIFLEQNKIQIYLKEKYETEWDGYTFHNFKNMSCEDIAEEILELNSDYNWVEVLEDNLGGAKIER